MIGFSGCKKLNSTKLKLDKTPQHHLFDVTSRKMRSFNLFYGYNPFFVIRLVELIFVHFDKGQTGRYVPFSPYSLTFEKTEKSCLFPPWLMMAICLLLLPPHQML